MKIVKGTYNQAKVFTDIVEETAIKQIENLCSMEEFKESKIRIMPDVHAGSGCTIGTTMTIKDKIIPNLVGVDIGCGMITIELGNIDIDLPKLDIYINKHIPSGFNINKNVIYNYNDQIENNIKCFKYLGKTSTEFSKGIGTLGGGNHFIEIDADDNNNKYLVIHTGSRNIGNRVAKYYQDMAYNYNMGLTPNINDAIEKLIIQLKEENNQDLIQSEIQKLKEKYNNNDNTIDKELCYVTNDLMHDYLNDINIIQEYSRLNRETIAEKILNAIFNKNLEEYIFYHTIHNYIDIENMILRKGAISAQNNEKVLIPINMRDGSLICVGKGNADWNYSAPHGAGRLMSRVTAKNNITLEQFQDSMKGIYSTSINKNTLDESAFAYKNINDIIDNINDTVDIIKIIKPVYNFKNSI